MMVDPAEREKAIREPCVVIQDLLESGQSPRDVCEYFAKVVNATIRDDDNGKDNVKPVDIPLLGSLVSLPVSGSLVRVRCMIQDVFGPEMYQKMIRKYHAILGGSVAFESDMGEDDFQHGDITRDTVADRMVYACVKIPSECSWVSSNHGEDADDEKEDDCHDGCSAKRRECSIDDVNDGFVPGTPSESSKPVQHPDFLVKVYDGGFYASEDLHVNGLYEIVGVLETDISFHSPDASPGESFPESESSHNPPSLICPRIHMLTCRELSHGNGHCKLLPQFGCPFGAFKVSDHVPSFFTRAREAANCARGSIIAFLAQALGGDLLAAEFVMLALMAKITARYDGLNVGQLAVALSGVTDSSIVSNTVDALRVLWPRVTTINLTVEMLNDGGNLAPYKDYTQERLVQTPLQLPVGTLVVLDETMLEPGKLNPNGQRNLQHLRNLVQWQRVSYDFAYHESEFTTDCPILSLCRPDTPSAVLGAGCSSTVPLRMSEPSVRAQVMAPYSSDEAFFSQARFYLSAVRELPQDVDSSLLTQVQNDFVEARKQATDRSGARAVTQETLHYWMNLARAVSLSFGEQCLTSHAWDHMKSIEAARLDRIQPLP